VKEALARLIELQRADTAAALAGRKRDEIDRALRDAEKLLAGVKAEEEAAHKALQEAQSAVHRREMDLKEREGRILSLQGKLNGATSNKEYQSILLEIATVKAENGKIEEQVLLAMDEVDAKEKLFEAAKAKTRETEGIVRAAKADVDHRRAAFEAQMAASKAERDTIAAAIPAEALRIYERIRGGNRSTGTAVVEVHGEYCQGCQMSITPQEFSDLIGGTRIVLCRSCQRILVLAADGSSLGPPPTPEP
jgi:predicted  nucleic acid-binding Zn-ribbon protein